jgi:hypothetical protein
MHPIIHNFLSIPRILSTIQIYFVNKIKIAKKCWGKKQKENHLQQQNLINGKILKFGTTFEHFYHPLPLLTSIVLNNKFHVD